VRIELADPMNSLLTTVSPKSTRGAHPVINRTVFGVVLLMVDLGIRWYIRVCCGVWVKVVGSESESKSKSE
jgi:hypothetical protein